MWDINFKLLFENSNVLFEPSSFRPVRSRERRYNTAIEVTECGGDSDAIAEYRLVLLHRRL